MNSKILIVEDEAKIGKFCVTISAARENCLLKQATECRRFELIDENEFDAVLLDIMMPELDGLSVCRAVRRTNDVPHYFPHRPFRRGGQTAGL